MMSGTSFFRDMTSFTVVMVAEPTKAQKTVPYPQIQHSMSSNYVNIS
jgi:hypothetical protein